VSWDFSTDPDFQEQLDWMAQFVRQEIWPLESVWHELPFGGRCGIDGLRRALAPLQEQVKERGLWATHLPPELGGQGMGQVRLGLMHEVLGGSPIAPLAFGNAAPDSGNSELIALAGSDEQKERWLHPLRG
jgi:acyl-CoA dehydrogenase